MALNDRIRLHAGCAVTYELESAGAALLQLAPRRGEAADIIRETWESDPAVSLDTLSDLYGNTIHRTTLGPGTARVRYDATVEVSTRPDPASPDAGQHRIEELPAEPLHYLLASRYCESDVLAPVAAELFAGSGSGWPLAQAICDWVHTNLGFRAGSSDLTTTAKEIYDRREGVCRDFAHLFISFCRSLNLPARYVFGYLPDVLVEAASTPMDFYAWAEVYLAGRWWTFDPRNNQRRVGRVVIGRGRDAVDVAMVTMWGRADLVGFEVWAEEIPE